MAGMEYFQGLTYNMFRVYRKISEASDKVKEIFMSSLDLQLGDIIVDDFHKQDPEVPLSFFKVTKIDLQYMKVNGQVGVGGDPCDDPRGRLDNETGLRIEKRIDSKL